MEKYAVSLNKSENAVSSSELEN
jgi:hypothetical protein